MYGGCRNVARASGRCALSSACTDLVSRRIYLLICLFVVMCEMLEFVGEGRNLNHPTKRGKKPRAGGEVPISAKGLK